MQEEYILIVDDDKDIQNLLGIYLKNEGYKFLKCGSVEAALELLEQYKVMLILLDVMLPDMNGIEGCMKIRESRKMPIIFLSAKVEDLDIVQGLMAGGDDYVTKPFHPVQLMSRIKAQLRRYQQYNGQPVSDGILEADDLCVNTASRQAWAAGKELRLTVKEYAILELLLQNKGNLLSIRQIYEKIWREEFYDAENTVMMHIANLRAKLREASEGREYIQTVWGRGYKI